MSARRALRAGLLATLAALPAAADVQVRMPKPKGKAKPPQNRLQGIAVATLAYAGGPVERQVEGASGKSALRQGEFVRTGDEVKTGPATVARIDFPWMSVTASPGTTLHIPSEVILSAVFDAGRAEIEGVLEEVFGQLEVALVAGLGEHPVELHGVLEAHAVVGRLRRLVVAQRAIEHLGQAAEPAEAALVLGRQSVVDRGQNGAAFSCRSTRTAGSARTD